MVSLLPMSWKGVNSGVSRKRGGVGAGDIAKHARRAQAGACGDIGHQTALVAKLGIRRAGNNLHALNSAGGKLGGKDFALLIANGLAIDDECALRVIAQGMEETVAVGRNAAGAI